MSLRIGFTKYLALIETKASKCVISGIRRLSQLSSDFKNDLNVKNKIYLENSFTKSKQLLNYNQTSDGSSKWMTMYCCGPTIYDDSHLGHAFTYIRCDLIRRVLHKYHNIYVFMAMNITDIDDKIITKAIQTKSDFKKVSNIYCNSFIEDMKSLNVLDANCYLRVSDHIKTITDYINKLLDKRFAYISSSGDINFDFEYFRQTFNISTNSGPDLPLISEKSLGKKSPKDFTLWKSAKPGEPKWDIITSNGQTLPGRPECSALAHKVFGHRIDLHFGGADLRFPHHHNESCCSHAFQEVDKSDALYGWVDIWLHSGHLNLKSEKMSKSLGNVILIKDFLKDYSPNILRLFCIKLHYRSDLIYEERLLQEMRNTDKKLLEFNENVNLKICELSSDDYSFEESLETQLFKENSFSEAIDRTERLILEGIADDLDLEIGLNAILDLAKLFNSSPVYYYSLFDLMRTKALLNKWTDCMGLKYRQTDSQTGSQNLRENILINSLVKFRSDVRNVALKSKKAEKSLTGSQSSHLEALQTNSNEILSLCDKLRHDLDGFGIKLKDLPVFRTE